MLPLISIGVYLTKDTRDSYLYVLFVTTEISLIYEFLNMRNKKYSLILKLENIVCCFVLFGLLIWDVFMLTYVSSNAITDNVKKSDYVSFSLFGVLIIVTIIEIIRCIVYDINSSKHLPDKNNMKGAFKV